MSLVVIVVKSSFYSKFEVQGHYFPITSLYDSRPGLEERYKLHEWKSSSSEITFCWSVM